MFDTREFFNQKADKWDGAVSHDPRHIDIMLALCAPKPGSVLLDVGCGTGFLEPYLLGFQPYKIIAIDFAARMIERAREKLCHPDVEFRHTDFFQLDDVRCDGCFFLSSFPHFPDPEQVVAHVNTLIKPGGRLCISHAPGKRNAGPELLTPMLPAQGLVRLLQPYYRLDAIIDNSWMLLVSGVRLPEAL